MPFSKNNVFYRVTLTGLADDVEIIGGPDMITYELEKAASIRPISYDLITKDQAKEAIKDTGYGVGIFIEDGRDITLDENRRAKAADLIIYMATRLGSGVVHEPIAIN
jgi:hypothetical protein